MRPIFAQRRVDIRQDIVTIERQALRCRDGDHLVDGRGRDAAARPISRYGRWRRATAITSKASSFTISTANNIRAFGLPHSGVNSGPLAKVGRHDASNG